jgi:hypothetical protein
MILSAYSAIIPCFSFVFSAFHPAVVVGHIEPRFPKPIAPALPISSPGTPTFSRTHPYSEKIPVDGTVDGLLEEVLLYLS